MEVGTNISTNFSFLLLTLVSFLILDKIIPVPNVIVDALTIEPNHDKPCIVGDAWAEECVSCICLEGRIASCKPSFCATRLRRDLDDCKEGEITKIDCNTCECKNNARVCTKLDCGKGEHTQRHTRKSKRKDRRVKRIKGKL